MRPDPQASVGHRSGGVREGAGTVQDRRDPLDPFCDPGRVGVLVPELGAEKREQARADGDHGHRPQPRRVTVVLTLEADDGAQHERDGQSEGQLQLELGRQSSG